MARKHVYTAFAGTLLVAILGSTISSYNAFVALEARLEAQDAQTQNVYTALSNDIATQGLTVETYRAAVIEALRTAMSGRYGDDGVQGALVAIREQNPTISDEVFGKLQTIISASYRRFERAQQVKLDIVREYDTALHQFPSNITASVLGFPRTDLNALRQIVTNAATRKAFESKTAEPIDPFAKR